MEDMTTGESIYEGYKVCNTCSGGLQGIRVPRPDYFTHFSSISQSLSMSASPGSIMTYRPRYQSDFSAEGAISVLLYGEARRGQGILLLSYQE